MSDLACSFKNVNDANQKYIAACGGGSGLIVVWKLKHAHMDLPSAVIQYEGKIHDIKIVQDLDREIGVLLTLHSDPNCLIVTALKDFKFIKKINLPCKLNQISVHPLMNQIYFTTDRVDEDLIIVDLGFKIMDIGGDNL